jgi:protein-S-isoprenylcysteine O-methyltransferase Ste14
MASMTADNSGVKVFPPAIYLVGLAAGFLLHKASPQVIATGSFVAGARILGWLLVFLWVGLNIWALVTFFRAHTSPNPRRPTTVLAFHGPYRFTRNPMYLSLAFLQVGVALVANALWPLLFAIPTLWVVRRVVIDREEVYLKKKFGQEYVAYLQRVRRWL